MDYLKIYNTLDSTNKEAHRLLAEGPVLKDLTLFAIYQTEGRGQLGRPWLAESRNHLAMSLIHQPDSLSSSELSSLGMKVSLGIVNALKDLEPTIHPLIKWPNDIYVDGKKLSGILIENSLSGTKVQHSIIGIGMNVNESGFPPEIPNAVSLQMLTGKEYKMIPVLNHIRSFVLQLLYENPSHWKVDYDQYVFGKGKLFHFISKGVEFEAVVIGVSLDGKLTLRMNDNHMQSFASHEVKWIMQ